jgi:hypothetical protein
MLSNIKDVKDILAKMPMDVSIGLWGPPGIGKTDLCLQVAKATGSRFKVYLAATMDPTDLVGVPFANETKKTTVFYPPEQLLELCTDADEADMGPVVACFDDITTADDHVFAALFRLFQHREVAGRKIRDNVRLIATGNRVEDKAAAKDLPTALNNRFWHVDINVSADDWKLWAIENNVEPTIVGYISARPDKLHCFKPDDPDRAFATPRSVAMASKIQASIGVTSPMLHLAISGCVGEAWSTEYTAFLRNTEHLVKPEDIMKDPKGCRVPSREQVDVIHATIASLTYYVANNASVETCLKAFTYAERIPHPDMGMTAVHNILRGVVQPHKDPSLKAKIVNSPAFTKLIEEHGYLLIS